LAFVGYVAWELCWLAALAPNWYRPAGLLDYVSLLFGVGIAAFYSYGVVRGYRWGLVVAALNETRSVCATLHGAYHKSLMPEEWTHILLSAVIIAYCGLRLVGRWPPNIGMLLPQRDDALYED
jgi:hypothetical protein